MADSNFHDMPEKVMEPQEKHIQHQSSVESDASTPKHDSAFDSEASTSKQPDAKNVKKKWWHSIKEPGSALQIVSAAALAIAIGMAVTSTVDEIPEAAPAILGIPGALWLRALRATVLPLIVCAMILAVQNLKEMTKGGAVLAKWTIGYYVLTTILAIVHSIVMVDLVWRRWMVEAGAESLQISAADAAMVAEREDVLIHEVVVDMFESLIPANIVDSLANDGLLAVLVSAVIVGYLIQGPDSSLLRAVREVEKIITVIITFLIKMAPIGVFFLILPNLFRLDIGDIGQNLGILIGGSLSGMFIHLFVVIPIVFFLFTRKNPYSHWIKCSPAWITAWGTASSAATLPVTIKVARKLGIPETVNKFVVPLGCLINMDGTAIYFPVVVVFLAATQGITLNPADYTIVVLLSTLASIGTTPIPSSSLVLTVMIAGAINVPVTGMYAVVVAIDWFIDRFRTATNVSCDLYAVTILAKVTGIKDSDEEVEDIPQEMSEAEESGNVVTSRV